MIVSDDVSLRAGKQFFSMGQYAGEKQDVTDLGWVDEGVEVECWLTLVDDSYKDCKLHSFRTIGGILVFLVEANLPTSLYLFFFLRSVHCTRPLSFRPTNYFRTPY